MFEADYANNPRFTEIIILHIKIDSAFLDQHGDPVAWHAAH
jgi:hypothetical protein